MSRIRWTPGSTVVADAHDVALAGVDRAAARVEQRAEHGGVDERRAREVDDDAAAAAEGLVEPFAQRRRGVDVVLPFDDDHDDVPGGVVEHDRIGVHTARARYPRWPLDNVTAW